MQRISRVHRRVASLSRQRGFVRLPMFIARWGSKPFRIQDLFRANEPGVHFETYNPNDILRRTNLATNTGFTRGTTGAVPTDYIERGLVTGRRVVDASTSSGFAMRVTSAGGAMGASDDVRHAGVGGLSIGAQYTVRFRAKRAPGFTSSALRAAFGGTTLAPEPVLTDAYQSVAFTHVATGASHSLFFGGPNGALYDVTDIEVVKTSDAALPYQFVTDWNTEFLAAGGDRVTMFQDATCTTPITAVEQTIGAIISSERGTARGPNVASATTSTAGWSGTSGVPLVSSDGTSVTITNGSAAESRLGIAGFAPAVGDVYEITFTVAAASSGGAIVIGARTTLGGVGAKRYVFAATATSFYFAVNDTAQGSSLTVRDVSVRKLPGSVATQSTAGAKPKLEARVNLLLKTQEFDDAAWTKTDTTVTANAIAAPDGTLAADLLTEGVVGGNDTTQSVTLAASVSHKLSVRLKRGNHDWVRVQLADSTFANNVRCWVNLATGALGTASNTGTATGANTAAVMALGNGWYEVSFTANLAAFTAARFQTMSATGDAATARVANGTRYVWGADLRTAADAALDIPTYQRVNTATDYDTDGFPHRVRHDKLDDFLSVPLNMSATDKVTAWMSGNLKQDDATAQVLFELTASSGTTAGGLAAFAPGSVAANYGTRSRGSATADATTTSTFPAPRSDVLTMTGDIAADVCAFDLNGVQAQSVATDQGAGSYANDTLYIGRRGGASLPSGAGWSALTIRGALSDAGTKTKTNRYHARLAKINL